jgi:RNA polymerase-binding transcription factor DksA
MSNIITRYTDGELEEFRLIIEDKLSKAKDQFENLIGQIKEITENTSGDFTKDLTDFSSSQTEVELLNSMATRQRTYIQDLQNALIRIKNKSYGICVVTGQLIDKKRLYAVPTTTKSVVAKTEGEEKAKALLHATQKSASSLDAEEDEEDKKKLREAVAKKPVIITKVIKKPTASTKAKKVVDEDEDDELDEILKELDNFGEEGPEVAFDDDLDMADDSSDDFEDDFDAAEEIDGDDED